jgi:hypothetical protein
VLKALQLRKPLLLPSCKGSTEFDGSFGNSLFLEEDHLMGFHAGFLLRLFFNPENGGDVPPKLRLTLNGLHGVISQKMVLFIITAVRTSNPTQLVSCLFALPFDPEDGVSMSRSFTGLAYITSHNIALFLL